MSDRFLSGCVIVLAIGVRAAAVLLLQSHTVPHSTYEHGEIAANLLAGRGFSVRFLGADGPTSQQAPLYPVLVAAAYALGGVGTPRALLILELGQAVLGGLLVLAVLSLAREVAPGRPRLALLAAFITALHPTLVYAATHVQVALLAATWLVATLAGAFRTGRTGRLRDAGLTGLGLAGLALTDPILALVTPGLLWAIALGQPRQRACWLTALVALVAAAGVAPWVVRNVRVHGELVWIKSTFGYAFWQGNCALSEGTDKVVRSSVERALALGQGAGLRGLNQALWAARHEAGYLDDIALTQADYRALGSVSEPERSRMLFRRALADLRAEPGRYPRLCLRRLRYFVLFDETNPKTRNIVYRSTHLCLTLLAALGLVLAGRELRWRLAPTLLTAALIALFHTLTIISARFHIPLEPLMALWAAAGLSRLQWLQRDCSAAPAHDVVHVGIERRLGVGVGAGSGVLRSGA
jgi:4-amino-4-deoxy-L-arabinose transferase-like glycosyltransferase